jgi:tetratricopeptide (TPR) repeat protein
MKFVDFRSVGAALTLLGLLGLLAACASTPAGSGQSKENLPRDPDALLIGAERALQRKEYPLAAQALAAAAAASDDESLAERATRVAFEHHQDAYVLRSAQRWLDINPTSEEARRFAGVAALRLYRIDDAAVHFESLLRSAFISPQAGFVALLPQLSAEGSRPATMALFKILADKFSNAAEAHFALAQAALAGDNHALALTSARRAAELSPYWILARSMLARAQSVSGEHDAALETMRSILEQEDKAEYRLEYAHMLYAAGKEADARRELDRLTEDDEAGAGAQRILALFDMDSGQYETAANRYYDLVRAGRFVYEGMFRLGQISERRNAINDAVELYTRVTTGDYALPAQARAARLKARNGAVADGLAVLDRFAEEHDEMAVEIIAAKAAYLADMNDTGQALRLLKDALADYPDHEALRYAEALLLERMNRVSDAIAVMRGLVRDRPNDPSALNMLGYTLVDRKNNPREGLELIRAALAQIPDNAAVLDSMGWALFRMNKASEALPYLERALRMGNDPEIALHLGDVLWALDRRDEATATWEKALAGFPDQAELKSRLAKRKTK